jgi:dihydrofolate synthase/folylpolyglutamate synthase
VTGPATLDDWLAHWTALHAQPIVLGLERVAAVASRMGLGRPAPVCITVGGTNGKGSTVAFLDAILRAAGHSVGCYTSPHLLAYNERVRIDGVVVDDAELVAAFARIEAARGGVPLTYFEAGTLAALAVFEARAVDVAVLEVGLGGRLDAVNIVDADVSIVTTVDLDHQAFLGPDRESIGREKAGIFRTGRPAVVGDHDPPASLLRHAGEIGALLQRAGIDFRIGPATGQGLRVEHADGRAWELAQPALPGDFQERNAACAIVALHALRAVLPIAPAAIAHGVANARCAGRLQRIAVAPETFVDVAHNPQAARALAHWLDGLPTVPTAAVFAALGDKDIDGIATALRASFAHWWVAGLAGESPRGLDADATLRRLASAGIAAQATASVAEALHAARASVGPGGRVLAFGSFLTVAAAMRAVGLHQA